MRVRDGMGNWRAVSKKTTQQAAWSWTTSIKLFSQSYRPVRFRLRPIIMSASSSTVGSGSQDPGGVAGPSLAPASPASSTISLPESNGVYDPNEEYPAPLGADLDKEPSIDGTSIGAGSQFEGNSESGDNGIRKARLEDIDHTERAVSISTLRCYCSILTNALRAGSAADKV